MRKKIIIIIGIIIVLMAGGTIGLFIHNSNVKQKTAKDLSILIDYSNTNIINEEERSKILGNIVLKKHNQVDIDKYKSTIKEIEKNYKTDTTEKELTK